MKKGIEGSWDVDMSVLMGANVANEVAAGDFAEATIGCTNAANGLKWCKLFNTPDFAVTAVADVAGAELCGAMKNVVALGAGFSDGLGYGGNTKAAIIRIGLKEMQKFCQLFYGDRNIKDETFLESCGVADLVTTCFGGRNRKCAEIFAKNVVAGTPKTWESIEAEELNGQKLQGTGTSEVRAQALPLAPSGAPQSPHAGRTAPMTKFRSQISDYATAAAGLVTRPATPLAPRESRRLIKPPDHFYRPRPQDVTKAIKAAGKEADFPLFMQIHKIAFEGAEPASLIEINSNMKYY